MSGRTVTLDGHAVAMLPQEVALVKLQWFGADKVITTSSALSTARR